MLDEAGHELPIPPDLTCHCLAEAFLAHGRLAERLQLQRAALGHYLRFTVGHVSTAATDVGRPKHSCS